MKDPEVLSPAGSWDMLRAAASAGADAVYLGGRLFNARRNAANFDDDELGDAIAFCHARGMRAYITLNTLLFQNELGQALSFIGRLCELGADALIVQDTGIAALVKKAAPSLKLHASTQMAVHNIEGVQLLAKMGFSRVILARELAREELRLILKASPIEAEVFVHGALCMSLSGECYLSGMLGGRSGNRGLCAQPCRLPFSAPGGTGRDLSLKDLSLLQYLPELAEMGVSSFKIEGRMKRPEYVAAATAACKTALSENAISEATLSELQSVFSRSGFTDGYYTGIRGRAMFGAREKEDVMAAGGVLSGIRARYEGVEPGRVPVTMRLKMVKGEPSRLLVNDRDGNASCADGAEPEAARVKPLDPARAEGQLAKTGGTPFLAEEISCELGEGLTLPIAEINRMRRDALEGLFEKRMAPRPIPFSMPELSTSCEEPAKNTRELRIRLRSFGQMTQKVRSSGAEYIFLPVCEINENTDLARELLQSGVRLGAELPRAVFGSLEKSLGRQVSAAERTGIRDFLCGNLGALGFITRRGLCAHGDFGLNIANAEAVSPFIHEGLASCTLSAEAALPALALAAKAAPGRSGAIAYGRLPLMLLRNCPLKNGTDCEECGGLGTLKDRLGKLFPVICAGEASELLNSCPLWLCDKKEQLYNTGIRFAVLYFTIETAKETDAVLEAWEHSLPCRGEFTRGLYYRGVQ